MMRTQNVTKAFRAASTADRADGVTWYPRARALARELDPADPVRGAAVIAVLSPMLAWPRNVKLAREAYAIMRPYLGTVHPFASPAMLASRLGCLRGSATKAFRILAGEAPENVVGGQKVTSFFNNIVDPAADPGVTVDRHAIDIAFGKVMSDDERSKAIAGKNGYDNLAKLYKNASKVLSKELGVYITPNQVQAVTWVYWRRNMAKANHG
jgi:hypothetical protein